MQNKKIFYTVLFVFVLFGFASMAAASVTISGTSIIGTVGSTIDIGAGNTLLIQTVGNAPVTIGTGLVTLGGNLKIVGLAGSGTKCLHVDNTGAVGLAAADCGSGGGSQPTIFSSGTAVQQAVECAHGTVGTAQLSGLAAGASGEVTLQTGISGDVRWQGILLSETTQFTGTNLTVSMGRPGSTTHAEMTNGVNFPLGVGSSDTNYFSTRPIPPQITSTYGVVLNFAVTSGNVNASTGSLTWEMCGYKAR
ncbi:hypothetical protein HY311_03935 [Candidatus Nomurabacteria bacterium]|nr:hypothetical protein [Candidatus Nomurabacteria bacterium]